MKLAFVVQRYGPNLAGGAEGLAKQIAEKIVERKAANIHVFTTTAKDYQTWKNEFPAGYSILNGVSIHRFNVRTPRFQSIFRSYNILLKSLYSLPFVKKILGSHLRKALEQLWLLLQGPWSPSLLNAIVDKHEHFDQVFFFTYLYYPTVYGLEQIGDKSILVPSAHQEFPLELDIIQKSMNKCKAIFYNTKSEGLLLSSIIDGFQNKSQRVGIGLNIDKNRATSTTIKKNTSHSLPKKPYLLYLGRISRGKGVHVLIQTFQSYIKNTCDHETLLVLAGHLESDISIPPSPQIIFLGKIADEIKFDLISGCKAFINPSPLESMSIVVLEAMTSMVPVIVNGKCAVFQDYALTLPTVYSYANSNDLERLIGYAATDLDKHEINHKLVQTKEWVSDYFNWDRVINAYCKSLPKSN